MKAYFYHTQDRTVLQRALHSDTMPRQMVYGMLRWQEHGVTPIWHPTRLWQSRLRMMLYNTWHILTCRERYSVLFATHYRGIEPVVLLRALRLYRHPIIVWHHQPVITSSGWRKWVGKLFYRGFDHLFFFSQKLMDESLATGKVPPSHCHLGHWGADLQLYDRIMSGQPARRHGFISTGKERRDFPTLIKAFGQVPEATLRLFLPRQCGDDNYVEIIGDMTVPQNVSIIPTDGMSYYDFACEVNKAACVVICVRESKYTVGLTTLVEAMALGLPIVTSRNPQFPFDVEAEQCGLCVDYGDVEGWRKAIEYIVQHPDEAQRMGRNARRLAERCYNDEICAREVVEVMRSI